MRIGGTRANIGRTARILYGLSMVFLREVLVIRSYLILGVDPKGKGITGRLVEHEAMVL